jgi:predicted MFS family arabinose efflux permease
LAFRFITSLSVFALAFISLFPAIAERHLGLDTKTATYGWLYGTFGVGSLLGSMSLGTVFAGTDTSRLIRPFLAGFVASMTAFAVTTSVAVAFPVVFILGLCYFPTTTSLLTVVQLRIGHEIRGRIMSLWFMAFGGTVPLGGLIFGPLLDRHGGTPVLLIGAAAAAVLWLTTNVPAALQRAASN